MNSKRFLTPDELLEEYGLGKKWQDKWRPLGLPYIKLGGYIRYHRETVEEWILKHSILRGESA